MVIFHYTHAWNSQTIIKNNEIKYSYPPNTNVLYWWGFLLLLKETFPDCFYECTRSSFMEYKNDQGRGVGEGPVRR